MDYTTRRLPLRRSKRIALNVTLAPEIHAALERIGDGNRSAGVEEAVRFYIAKCRAFDRARILATPI